MFITFEGGEGAGKSSQIREFEKWLKAENLDIITTREPGGCPKAETIRELLVSADSHDWDPITEVLLFTTARRNHIQDTIFPAFENNNIVLCDRYIDSTIAYQGVGHGLDKDIILDLHKKFCYNLFPDITFLFDINPIIGIERSLDRTKSENSSENKFEKLKIEFHQNVRQSLFKRAEEEPNRFIIIDANQDFESVTTEMIEKFIEKVNLYS